MTRLYRVPFIAITLFFAACASSSNAATKQEAEERRRIESLYNDTKLMAEINQQALHVFTDVDRPRREELQSGKSSPPKLRHRVDPEYPAALLKQGVQGIVWMGFIVDRDGNVERIEALGDSSPQFVATAKAAIAQWKYFPAILNDKPVRTIAVQPMMFTFK